MARSVSVCAPLGLLFFIQLSAGCSANNAASFPPTGNNGGQGTGNSGNNGGAGNTGATNNGGGYVVQLTSTSVLTTDIVKQLLKSCGNGKIDPNEQCDDSNTVGGDGCSKTCQIENTNEWSCPTPGQLCTSLAVCGDGKLSSQEACDDGNANSGDGCSSDCKIEDGWQCRMPAKPCVPKCGDGKIVGSEQCDDGNTTNGDGCSSTCIQEPGFDCSSGTCKQIVCGDGVKTGAESCDLGSKNGLFNGDGTGCSKTCTPEPTCRVNGVTQACSTACGDGNIDPGESCDDGNQNNGDGCSSTCQTETGFNCQNKTYSDAQPCPDVAGKNCLTLPITFRDFDGQQVSGTGHPDFFYYGASVGGKVTYCVPNASLGPNEAVVTVSSGSTCADGQDQTKMLQGLVDSTLGTDGTPSLVLSKAQGVPCHFTDYDYTGVIHSAPGVVQCNVTGSGSVDMLSTTVNVMQSQDSFNMWYHDSTAATAGTTIIGQVELVENGTTTGGAQLYQFATSGGRTVYDDIHDIFIRDLPATPAHPALAANAVSSLTSGFFPLEGTNGGAGRKTVCNLWPYWLADKPTANGGNCTASGGNNDHSGSTTAICQLTTLGSGTPRAGGPAIRRRPPVLCQAATQRLYRRETQLLLHIGSALPVRVQRWRGTPIRRRR